MKREPVDETVDETVPVEPVDGEPTGFMAMARTFSTPEEVRRVVAQKYGDWSEGGQESWPFQALFFLLYHDTQLEHYQIAQQLGLEWGTRLISMMKGQVLQVLRDNLAKVKELEGLRRELYGQPDPARPIALSYAGLQGAYGGKALARGQSGKRRATAP